MEGATSPGHGFWRSLAWILIFGVALCFATGLAPILAFALYVCFDEVRDAWRDRTEEQLIEVFHEHRAEVERLRALWLEDRTLGIIESDHKKIGMSEERYAEYQRLLEALGALAISGREDAQDRYDTEISLGASGSFFRSVYKYFVFAPGDVPPQDQLPTPTSDTEDRFTRLGDGWYLRYLEMS